MAKLSAEELLRKKDGDWVTVGGLVIVRQRPQTAKGFCFVTMEDETGLVNVVVTPQQFEANRRVVVKSPLLVVRGVLQVEQGVYNVRGREFVAATPEAGTAYAESHDFH